MTVLILNKRPLKTTPYHSWLEGADKNVVLFSSMDNQSSQDMELARERFSEARFFSDYDTGAIEAQVLALHERRPISRIVALSEVDLFRAARLREILGLPGMRTEAALAFRDKFVMKSILNEAGVATAPMAQLRTASDLLLFAREVGFPLVVKPRALAGSMGVNVLRSQNELEALLMDPAFSSYALDTGLIAEKFVRGQLYHIDGIAVGSRVAFSWPSHYMHGILDFVSSRQPCSSVMLGPEHELRVRLQEFAAKCVRSLPFPEHPTAFHAEAFVSDEGEIVLCEIAARPGGGGITDLLANGFGIDLNEIATRGAIDGMVSVGPVERPKCLAALILFPKQVGTLEQVPTKCAFEYVSSYATFAAPGSVFSGSKHSIDRVALAHLSAPSEALLRERTRELAEWFANEVKWIVSEPQLPTERGQ